ncbi:MAG: PucR family transcriptional regulator [Acidimicrobiales bacterium]
MTLTADRPPALVDLADRVAHKVPELARTMVTRLSEDVPFYSHLPREQLDGDISSICRHNIKLFLKMLGGDMESMEADLEVIRTSTAYRAEEGVPLEALLRAYHVGLSMMWDYFRGQVGDAEPGALVDVATLAMDYIELVTSLVSHVYLEEYEIISNTQRDVRRAVTDALLSGETAAGLTGLFARAGVAMHSDYVAVALAIGPSADEGRPDVESRVAARRKVRRVSHHLERAFGHDLLAVLDPSGGMVLVPVDAEGPASLGRPIAGLVEDISHAVHCSVIAGYAWSPGLKGVVHSGAEAWEVMDLARHLELPPGAYRRADLLFEYAVTRDRASVVALADLLDPLHEIDTDLVGTLRAYLDLDVDRRRTAAHLHIHPNTLDYRLRRIRSLTGLDANSATGASVLRAALVAWRMRSHGGP